MQLVASSEQSATIAQEMKLELEATKPAAH